MTDNSMPNVDDQASSPDSEQATRPTEESQAGSPHRSTQQTQAGSSGQRAPAGRTPLFRR